MARKSELVDLEMIVVRDAPTDRAVLAKLDEDAEKVWLPRSMIEIEYVDRARRLAKVTMTESFATEKGLV